MEDSENGSIAYRRTLICMLLGSIVSFAVMYCPQPLISLFTKEYHVSPSTASFSLSFTTIALAVSMLFVPILSNVRGRKGIMAFSLLLTSVLTIASSFVHNFHLFLLIRLLQGISIAGFPGIAMAYLNEEFSPKKIGGIMGVYVAGTSLGGFTGRIVIGALTDIFSWQIALAVLGSVSVLCSIWFWRYLPDSRNFHASKGSLKVWGNNMKRCLVNVNLLSIYAIGFLFMGIYITLLNYIGYPLTHAPYNLSQTVFGFLFVVNLFGTFSSIKFGKFADRFSRLHLIWISMAMLLGGALLTLNGLLVVKIIGIALFVAGFFGGHAVASGWIGILAPKNNKAQASSLYLSFYYGGSSLLGWSGGFFLQRFGWNGIVGYICILLGIVMLVSLQTIRQSRPSVPGGMKLKTGNAVRPS